MHHKDAKSAIVKTTHKERYVFFIGGGDAKRGCGPPTSQIELIHDPSKIPKQKHLTLPLPPPSKNNRKKRTD